MTDETRKQIKMDAAQWWARNDGPTEDPDGLFEDAYSDGATHQHPISFEQGKKEGWNEAIDACIKRLENDANENFYSYRQQLESLKKKG